jgi:F-type H+-transporting ATPase subunit gamma
MPSIKAIGMRLKSVTSTAKITKAMKLVAASKLRGAETKMKAGRPFVAAVQEIMMPKLAPGPDDAAPETGLIVAISSDKGLCGGINSKVTKSLRLKYDAGCTEEVIIVGGKVRDGFQRLYPKKIQMSMDEVYQQPVTFSLASFVAEQMLATPADMYTITYNKFKSVINFEVDDLKLKGPECLGESGVFDEFEFEGEKEEILADMYQYNLASSLYGCMLENVTSEQASRMTAMDNASNNAKDMISKLAILYNRLRQTAITTELTEIVAGAESV